MNERCTVATSVASRCKSVFALRNLHFGECGVTEQVMMLLPSCQSVVGPYLMQSCHSGSRHPDDLNQPVCSSFSKSSFKSPHSMLSHIRHRDGFSVVQGSMLTLQGRRSKWKRESPTHHVPSVIGYHRPLASRSAG